MSGVHEKSGRKDFRQDMDVLLRREISWDFDEALELVLTQHVPKGSGDPWRGIEA